MDFNRVREELILVATSGETIYYKCLGIRIAPELHVLTFSKAVSPILDAINRAEHKACRPLLSAVVVRKDSGQPGKGFFTSARKLGPHSDTSDEDFWQIQIARVHDRWRNHSSE